MLPAPAAADGPRGVVVIITDDQGYGDLSCHGNPVLRTPNLDGLHAESVRLTDYHVAPTCSPTRAALLTGRYPNRTGVWHTIGGRNLLPPEERTLDQRFADAGYDTAMFGKWHLGDSYPFRPSDRGFGHVFRHTAGGIGHMPDPWDNSYFDGVYLRNGDAVRTTGFCTDVWFDAATDFVRRAVAGDKKFFVYLATNAAHGPFHAPPEAVEPFAEYEVRLANFYGMLANIDENVGRFIACLDDLGIADDTLLIFTTDNGTVLGQRVFNAGMRGNKGSPYDGGHRVPFFVRWPDAGIDGGRDVDLLSAHIDVSPTLIELCDLDSAGPPPDGVSLASHLRGERIDEPVERILITDSQRLETPVRFRQSATMSSRWRLVDGVELYDIRTDPGQQADVAESRPDVVARLRGAYDAWWDSLAESFADATYYPVGRVSGERTELTAHDARNDGRFLWSQGHVRTARPDAVGTTWRIDVRTAGHYRIELRRWPRETAAPITGTVPLGPPVPGQEPYRSIAAKPLPITRAGIAVAGQGLSRPVSGVDTAAAFDVDLDSGPTDIRAAFFTGDGTEYGVYYLSVARR
ncbi:MAG: arylsulfatase [Planctomycetota bacterium]